MFGNSVQRRRPFMFGPFLFSLFYLFPLGPNGINRPRFAFTKNVRMTANQFLHNVPRHLVEIERATLIRELAMKHDLQQKVAKLLDHFVIVTCFNGVDQLIDLFDRMETERLVVLFPIPWASFRRTQFGHYLQQFKYRWSEFSICLLAFSSRLSVRPPPRRRV